jgi:acetyltransferase-like isoleucine patch superfamily enzyme
VKKLLQRWFAKRPAILARVDESAVLHPEAEIANLRGKPECINVGRHSHVRGQLLVFWESGDIQIGDWSYVGQGSRIWSRERVRIGSYVLISHGVDIHDTDGHPLDWEQRRQDIHRILGRQKKVGEREIASSPVVIEDDVWIGAKATVLKGITIGQGAVVGAGAVVTKNVAPFTLVAGNPARVIRELPR